MVDTWVYSVAPGVIQVSWWCNFSGMELFEKEATMRCMNPHSFILHVSSEGRQRVFP